jgi:hypothetical protein
MNADLQRLRVVSVEQIGPSLGELPLQLRDSGAFTLARL